MNRVRQPVGAIALVALGFFGARFTGIHTPALPGAVATSSMTPSDDVFATVRSVRPDPSGQVQIAYDETRRRVLSGRPDDQAIQKLLLAAAHEENASVRVESMNLLKERTGSSEVRDALLNALAHDPNDGVRLKALEGLKPLVGDADVRKTLSQVLLTDTNPAVRMQVVDLLVSHRDDSVVGVLQGLVQREDNNYVRLKLEKALKDMNASIGTF
jgi:HEAT repeat protein